MDARYYLHAKFQINILKKNKNYKTFRTAEEKTEKKEKNNSEYKRVVITTLKRK